MAVSTPEGRVKAAVKKYLQSLGEGCWFYMPVQNGMGATGIPDFIVCIHGWFLAIETKAPGRVSQTTPLQDRQLAGITAAGGIAIVVDNVAPVVAAIEQRLAA